MLLTLGFADEVVIAAPLARHPHARSVFPRYGPWAYHLGSRDSFRLKTYVQKREAAGRLITQMGT